MTATSGVAARRAHREQTDPAFVGRNDELTVLRTAADAVAAGASRVLWVHGEPGSGKTALLRQAVAGLPEDFVLLRAEADELAADQRLHLVGQLAVGLPGDPFAAGLALIGAVTAVTDGPVVVMVEDLQWADDASSAALLSAARRLTHDSVLLIISSRSGWQPNQGWSRLLTDPSRCDTIAMVPLRTADIRALAENLAVSVTDDAAARLRTHTAGHALWVRTLLLELRPEQLNGRKELPVPRSLAATTMSRLAAMPPDAVDLASALAVLGVPVPLALAAEVCKVLDGAAAWDCLLAARFVVLESDQGRELIRFSHPLYQGAVYADLSLTRRRELHRAAAAVLGHQDGLAHRVAAADVLDDHLVGDLVAAAGEHEAAGLPGLASKLLLWAHDLTTEPGRGDSFLLNGARLLLEGGLNERAGMLLERVKRTAGGPLRSFVLGGLAWAAGDSDAAERHWLDTTDNGNDSEIGPELTGLRNSALVQLGTLYYTQARGPEAVAVARQLLANPGITPSQERNAWVVLAVGEGLLGGAAAGLAVLHDRLPQPPSEVAGGDVDLLVARGGLGFFGGRVRTGIADLHAAVLIAAHGQNTQWLPGAQVRLSNLLFLAGDFASALQHGRAALSLVSDQQQVWLESQAHAVLGRIHAGLGGYAAANSHIEQAHRAATILNSAEAAFTVRIAKATLARAQDDPDGVIAAFASQLTTGRAPALPMLTSLGWWPMVISALITTGELKTAAAHIGALQLAAEQRRIAIHARLGGLEAELLAARGHSEQALLSFQSAAAALDGDDPLLDRAHLLWQWGALLRSEGHVRDGLQQLGAARTLLAGSGAAPFLSRLDQLLQVRPGAGALPPADHGLTAREQDVLALVRQGLTNRETAASMYVTDKAVEYHLSNIFNKLGVRSRRELRGLSSDTAG